MERVLDSHGPLKSALDLSTKVRIGLCEMSRSREYRYCGGQALDALETAGAEWVSEQRDDAVIERLQYGVDGDARANHDPAGFFPQRPTTGL